MFSKRAFNARRRKTQALAKKPAKVANEKPTTEIFVNQTVIPFKKTCDFCEEKRAVFHCPKCTTTATGTGDFLCDSCDLEVHRHVKRRNHIRTQIPDVTAREAVHKIMGCFKYLLARKVLVAKCRLEFQRFFDPPTKTYFYFRPSIQVFDQCPFFMPRRWRTGPARRAPARDAWRRSRSLAPRPRPSLLRSRPQSLLRSRECNVVVLYLASMAWERCSKYSREAFAAAMMQGQHEKRKSELA